MTRHQKLACAIVALVVTSAAVSGQTQTPPPPTNPRGQVAPPRGGRAGQRNPAAVAGVPPANVNQAQNQIQELWNAAVLRHSKQALNLNDQQFPQFFNKMTELQNVRDRHQAQHHRLINELGRLTRPDAPPADDATLLAGVKDLGDMEAQSIVQENQALAAVDAVLTPFQRARFRVFEENMEKLKISMLAEASKIKAPAPKD